MPVRHAHLALALAVLCLSSVAGCSDNDNGGGASATTTPPAASSAPASSAPASSSPPSTASPSGQGQTKITIDNFKFMPDSLTVPPGAKVTVTNSDTTTHTLTAVTNKAWDTGDIAVGKTVTFTAPSKPGTYKYVCTIHPFMTGTLTVR